MALLGHMADSANVATIQLFGRFYATTELPRIIEYDPLTLETLGTVDLSHYIPWLITMTPHPQLDKDGTLWNVGVSLTSSVQKFGVEVCFHRLVDF